MLPTFLEIAGLTLKIDHSLLAMDLKPYRNFILSPPKNFRNFLRLETSKKNLLPKNIPRKRFSCFKGLDPNRLYFKEPARLITYAFSQMLAQNKGLLLHAACVVKNKKAYLFLAEPGGGKSTVAKLCRRYQVLADDVLAVKEKDERFLAFATPWRQSEFVYTKKNLAASIKAIFFLKKARRISFQPLMPQEALIRILSRHTHFFLYTERPLVDKLFFTCSRFVKNTPAYLMGFSKNKNFWPKLERCL